MKVPHYDSVIQGAGFSFYWYVSHFGGVIYTYLPLTLFRFLISDILAKIEENTPIHTRLDFDCNHSDFITALTEKGEKPTCSRETKLSAGKRAKCF